MEPTQRFLAGFPLNLGTTVLLFLLGTLTLVFSMILTSRLAGGVDFGSLTSVLAKGAGLLAAITILQFLDFGIVLAGPVWFLGLMFFFGLNYRQTRILTRVNWGTNALWKVLFVVGSL